VRSLIELLPDHGQIDILLLALDTVRVTSSFSFPVTAGVRPLKETFGFLLVRRS
jgi:hypothetical protein